MRRSLYRVDPSLIKIFRGKYCFRKVQALAAYLGVKIRGTLDDIDPLNKVPVKRAMTRVKKGPP